jgi:hypothetical protein
MMNHGELRPCIVEEDKKALFHCWSNTSKVVPPSMMIGGHIGGVIADTFGIVEFEDGTVKKVYPPHIRFLDTEETRED